MRYTQKIHMFWVRIIKSEMIRIYRKIYFLFGSDIKIDGTVEDAIVLGMNQGFNVGQYLWEVKRICGK